MYVIYGTYLLLVYLSIFISSGRISFARGAVRCSGNERFCPRDAMLDVFCQGKPMSIRMIESD